MGAAPVLCCRSRVRYDEEALLALATPPPPPPPSHTSTYCTIRVHWEGEKERAASQPQTPPKPSPSTGRPGRGRGQQNPTPPPPSTLPHQRGELDFARTNPRLLSLSSCGGTVPSSAYSQPRRVFDKPTSPPLSREQKLLLAGRLNPTVCLSSSLHHVGHAGAAASWPTTDHPTRMPCRGECAQRKHSPSL